MLSRMAKTITGKMLLCDKNTVKWLDRRAEQEDFAKNAGPRGPGGGVPPMPVRMLWSST